MLSEALVASSAVDKRIIVDDYTRWVISDKFLYAPRNLFDHPLRQEVRETYKMIDELEQRGVQVKFTHPVGLIEKIAVHNHKKVVVIDRRIAYIGGINFSEHNFVWHDIMLRMEDAAVGELFSTDFLSTWDEQKKTASLHLPDMELLCLDGYSNEANFEKVLRLVDEAQEHIYVESPYITFPFLDRLIQARRRGCPVTLVTPQPNNSPMIREYILWESARANIEVWLYDVMSHLKAMLIDDRYLILGSSNFDYFSYKFHQEIVAILTNPELITEFMKRVFQEDIRRSEKPARRGNPVKGYFINLEMRFLGKLIAFFRRLRLRTLHLR